MIISRLKGGLGNQLFQYAFGRTLADKYSTQLLLDITWYESEIAKQGDRKFQLTEFNVPISLATPTQVSQSISAIGSNRRSWLGKPLWEIKNEQPKSSFSPSLFNKQSRHLLVDGYWQSEKFFSPLSEKLRQELTLKKQDDFTQKQHLLDKMNSENSVAVHVRRGDYLTKSLHGVLNTNYYQRAAAFLEEHVLEPTYYIFSDDPEWCSHHLDFLSPQIIVSTLDQQYSITPSQEMMLMAACHHQIIANSSFSWWGAWLNNNPSKQVIAPSKWFFGRENLPDMIPDDWIKIENEF